MQSITLIAAAPLGALAISVMPVGWALGIDVFTAVLGVVPLLFLSIPQPDRAGQSSTGAESSIWREFKEGVALVWTLPGLRQLYALLGVVVLIIMPSYTLVSLLVKDHFNGGASQVALMEGLAGAGMLAGGIFVAIMAPQRKMLWILLGFASSCLALALTGLAPENLFGVAVAWWVISGVTYVFGSAPLTALLQTVVPPHLQGRALSLLNMIMGLSAPVGLALIAPMGALMSISMLFALLGSLGALASISGFFSPTLMRLSHESSELGKE
jgi:DHA3 family macrolide efflux protein-like MFS transporter